MSSDLNLGNKNNKVKHRRKNVARTQASAGGQGSSESGSACRDKLMGSLQGTEWKGWHGVGEAGIKTKYLQQRNADYSTVGVCNCGITRRWKRTLWSLNF